MLWYWLILRIRFRVSRTGYSPLWNRAGPGWKLKDETQTPVRASLVCDNEVPENGKEVWYLIDENGLMITDRLIHVTYDGMDGCYLINQENDGHFGSVIIKDGIYEGVDVRFSGAHDGSFGRILNLSAVVELKRKFTVREVSFKTNSSGDVYTAVIRSRIARNAAQAQDQDTAQRSTKAAEWDEGFLNEDTGMLEYTCLVCGEEKEIMVGSVRLAVSFDLNYGTGQLTPEIWYFQHCMQ